MATLTHRLAALERRRRPAARMAIYRVIVEPVLTPDGGNGTPNPVSVRDSRTGRIVDRLNGEAADAFLMRAESELTA